MNRTSTGRKRAGARVGIGLVIAALLLAVKSGSGEPDGEQGPAEAAWPVGQVVAVGVEAGKARFEVPTPRDGSKVLVVVSAMARSRGPFPIRLVARSTRGEDRTTTLDRRRPTRRIIAAPAPGPIPPPTVGMPPAERVFSILAREGDPASASNYRRVRSRLRAVGNWVQVYVDEQDLGRVGPETLRDLVGTFDDHVLPTASRLFGPARDVDGDGRFTVLLTGRLSSLAGGSMALDGFVRGADFDAHLPTPFGNRADLMYLSAGLRAGPYLRTILAHEYTHAVTFCRKVADRPGGFAGNRDEEGWLDEGLAHLAEDLHGFSRENLDYRVRAFLAAPERYQLIVEDYYESDLFRSHGNRGSTYLFLRWCAERFGPGLLPALVRSPLRGVENLERITGVPFNELYREWSAALFLDLLSPVPEGTSRSAEDWSAAGPRTAFIKPDGRSEVWETEGTASHHTLVGSSPTGAVSIEVSGPPEAELQVTAVTLPDDLPRLELTANLTRGADGLFSLKVKAEQQDGAPVRLGTLCWGPLVPPVEPKQRERSVGTLTGADLQSALGGRDFLAPGDRVESAAIPLPGIETGSSPFLVRLVGTDGRGRRIVGWAQVHGAGEPEGSTDQKIPPP